MNFQRLILLAILPLLLASCASSNLGGKTILFYGNTCPHCRTLEETFTTYQVEEKFQFERKEVYDNKANANLLGVAASNCGMNPNTVGVPFLYAEDKCFIGIPDIEKYVSEKTGIQFSSQTIQNQSSPSATVN